MAPLSKYIASDAVSHEPNPWEGPLVVLPASYQEEEDFEGHSYSSAAMERQIQELEVSSPLDTSLRSCLLVMVPLLCYGLCNSSACYD